MLRNREISQSPVAGVGFAEKGTQCSERGPYVSGLWFEQAIKLLIKGVLEILFSTCEALDSMSNIFKKVI